MHDKTPLLLYNYKLLEQAIHTSVGQLMQLAKLHTIRSKFVV
jgi:hypothetical protein